MFSKILKYVKTADWFLIAAAALLLAVGLIMLYSITGQGVAISSSLMVRQLIFGLVGFALLFSISLFDYRSLQRSSGFLYVLTIVLLLLVFAWGHVARGSSRWIDLGFFRFQPAEFSKLFLIIILARFFALHRDSMDRFRNVLLSLVYVAIPAGLILIEPDLGSAIVLFMIWLGMLLNSRVNWKHIAILALIGVVVAGVGWEFVLHDYQRNRIETFLNPGADPLGKGYNVIQSTIAVGAGSFLGTGLGHGTQSQLRFIPERQTDFIFASLAEELGFVGAMFLLILFLLLFSRIVRTSSVSRDSYGRYVALGVLSMLLAQAVINIGMNIGIMPVTGIPLPLISYGGSSLFVTLVSLGLIESIFIRHRGLAFE